MALSLFCVQLCVPSVNCLLLRQMVVSLSVSEHGSQRPLSCCVCLTLLHSLSLFLWSLSHFQSVCPVFCASVSLSRFNFVSQRESLKVSVCCLTSSKNKFAHTGQLGVGQAKGISSAYKFSDLSQSNQCTKNE